MLALAEVEAERRNSYGIPMVEALDPNAVWDAPDNPTVDYAVAAVSQKQQRYYRQYDTDPKNPMDRSAHLWRVTKKN